MEASNHSFAHGVKRRIFRGVAVGAITVAAATSFLRPTADTAVIHALANVPTAHIALTALPPSMAQEVTDLTNPNTLNTVSAERVPAAYLGLSVSDRTAFQSLIRHTSSPTEQAFLFKALAAGHTVVQITSFAHAISGMSPSKMTNELTPVVVQQNTNSADDGFVEDEWTCAATELEVFRAQYDPIYSLAMRNGGMHADQLRIENMALRYGWVIHDLGLFFGMTTAGEQSELHALSPLLGTTYSFYQVNPNTASDKAWAVQAITASLAQGHPVMMDVGNSSNEHAVGVFAQSGDRFLLQDPGTGVTGWVTAWQIEHNELSSFIDWGDGAGGWNAVFALFLPNTLSWKGHAPSSPQSPPPLEQGEAAAGIALTVALGGGFSEVMSDRKRRRHAAKAALRTSEANEID